MKQFLALATLLISPVLLPAQTCEDYWLLQNGKTIEMTTTSNKGKTTGINRYTITERRKEGSSVISSVDFLLLDAKQKETAKGQMTMKCTNGNYQVDMRQFIPQQNMEQMKDIQTDAVFYLNYPSSMKVGDVLEPGEANIAIANSGIAMNMEINITERKVEGKETVTTPAGSWDCFKITSQSNMRMKVGGMGIPIKSSSTEYFAPGLGVVKTEGKYGKTELTAIR